MAVEQKLRGREQKTFKRKKKSNNWSPPPFHSPGLKDMKKRISFGTSQERKIFPLHHATDRLGIQLPSIRGDPFLGPGCYLIEQRSSFRCSLENKPLSKKGYVIGARTAQRFLPEPRTVTPSPAKYQPFWKKERKHQPVCAPFSTRAPRFPNKPLDKELFPGPGTYDVDKQLYKRVTWPMKFGSPDWSSVPMPKQRMLKKEVQKMTIDKEFRKNQARVAYLRLYFH